KLDQVTEYLTTAYAAIYAISPAGGIDRLLPQEKKDLERAFRDAFLFGSPEVRKQLEKVINTAHENRGRIGPDGIDANDLILALRRQLRELYDLPPVESESTAWVSTRWRESEQMQTLVANATERSVEDQLISIDDAAKRTGITPLDLMRFASQRMLSFPIGL